MKPKNKTNKLRVCYFGTYRAEYSRNRIMIEGLRRNGVEVIECHTPIWRSAEDRLKTAVGGWINPIFWMRFFKAYASLIIKWSKTSEFDVMIVGFPGYLDIFPARILCWLTRKPLVWDVLVSLFLICLERGFDKRYPIYAKLMRYLEWAGARLPDQLIFDTSLQSNWFQQEYNIHSEQIWIIPIGTDDKLFLRPEEERSQEKKFRVLYFGTYIPNHGVIYIIEAANKLKREKEIHIRMIGTGPERFKAEQLSSQYNLTNVEFNDWLDQTELIKHIAQSDVCLGVFGDTLQSNITFHNKILESMALGIPVITGNSEAIRSVMVHGEHIYLCDQANPQALAAAIRTLRDNPTLRNKIAENGYKLFLQQFTPAHIGNLLVSHIQESINK